MRAGAMSREEPHSAIPVELHVAFPPAPIGLAALHKSIQEVSKVLGLSPGKDYELLVSPTQILFQRLRDLATSQAPDEVEHGVLFGSTGQVEFREVSPGLFRIVAFREESPLTLQGWRSEDVPVLKDGKPLQHFLLWGLALDKGKAEWQEGRIPHPQSYPWGAGVEVPEHLALVGIIYRDPVSRYPLYVHWQGLRGAKGSDAPRSEKAGPGSGLDEEG